VVSGQHGDPEQLARVASSQACAQWNDYDIDLCSQVPTGAQLCGQNYNLVSVPNNAALYPDAVDCGIGLEISGVVYPGGASDNGGDGHECGAVCSENGWRLDYASTWIFEGVPMC
jgi:hypothetical protein